MNIKKELYKKIHYKFPDFVWKPQYMSILKLVSPFIKRFPVEVNFEGKIPRNGALIWASNHCNFYDTLVCNQSLKDYDYFCLAGNEPRGKITGLAFEGRGVVWVDREDKESRRTASKTTLEILKHGESLGESPEGTWNLTPNRLMLEISWDMAKNAIEASKKNKVYIVPVIIEYTYKHNTAKVEKATVTVCEAIEVLPQMDYKKLTESLTILYWTKRWNTLVENAKNETKKSDIIEIKEGDGSNFVYKRENLSLEQWDKFIEKLKSQYKTDWELEESYKIKTKEQKEQEQVEQDMEKIRLSRIKELEHIKQMEYSKIKKLIRNKN